MVSSSFSNLETSQHNSLSHPHPWSGQLLPPAPRLCLYGSPQCMFPIHLLCLSPNEDACLLYCLSYFTASCKHDFVKVPLKSSPWFVIISCISPNNTIQPNTTFYSYYTKWFILTSVWEITVIQSKIPSASCKSFMNPLFLHQKRRLKCTKMFPASILSFLSHCLLCSWISSWLSVHKLDALAVLLHAKLYSCRLSFKINRKQYGNLIYSQCRLFYQRKQLLPFLLRYRRKTARGIVALPQHSGLSYFSGSLNFLVSCPLMLLHMNI